MRGTTRLPTAAAPGAAYKIQTASSRSKVSDPCFDLHSPGA